MDWTLLIPETTLLVTAMLARISQVRLPRWVLLPQESFRAITAGRSDRSARLLVASRAGSSRKVKSQWRRLRSRLATLAAPAGGVVRKSSSSARSSRC